MANEKQEKEVKPEEYKSVREYKKWRNVHYSLKAAPFAFVLVPLGTEIGVNWGTWFAEDTGNDKVSLAFGLVMAVISCLLSVLMLAKKDSDLMKKIGPYYAVGAWFLVWGATFYLLYSILYQMAELFIWAGVSVLAGAIADTVDNNVAEQKYKDAKAIVDKYGLSNYGEWKLKLDKQAQRDAKEKENRINAVE